MAGYDLLLIIIEKFGYIALFCVLCLGLIGLPIPNEAVLLTGGALSESGVLHPLPAYIMLTLGICSSMTFNYCMGRFTSSKLGNWFKQKKTIANFIYRSQQLTDKYGVYAIPISQCLPFVRHATPYVLGMNKMRFFRFVIISYPTAAVWTMLYFILGHYVGERIPQIIKRLEQFELILFIALGLCIVLFFGIRIRKIKKKQEQSIPPM